MKSKVKLYDNVNVPSPDRDLDDLWQHTFSGIVVNIRNGVSSRGKETYATVEDQDGNHFDVEIERLVMRETK